MKEGDLEDLLKLPIYDFLHPMMIYPC